ncbi:transposase [Flavobacterium sp. TSSA_36]|uniref:transposase n=1 Tax=Flavobacterium sp. TSSA_36 TaxID=3447669 RepID=UPI003F365239
MKRKNRKRIRKEGFDYSQDNLYFITICVQNRICCFGSIPVRTGRDLSNNSNNSIHFNEEEKNEVDKIQMNLNEYGQIAKNQMHWLEEQYPYVVIHCFVIMPNHVHVILEIDRSLVSDEEIKIKSVSELIGAYKTTSSKHIHLKGLFSFAWQRSFHDHIIRNAISYERIFNYIETNPLRWHADAFFAEP